MIDHDYCYCTFKPDENMEIEVGPTKMNYIGDGKWKCPVCGTIHDYSDRIYTIRFKIEKKHDNDFEWVEATILKPYDKRLDEFNDDKNTITLKSCIEDDIAEDEYFKTHELGIFDIDFCYYWYRCSYEYNEWDLEMFIAKEEKVADLKDSKIPVVEVLEVGQEQIDTFSN